MNFPIQAVYWPALYILPRIVTIYGPADGNDVVQTNEGRILVANEMFPFDQYLAILKLHEQAWKTRADLVAQRKQLPILKP